MNHFPGDELEKLQLLILDCFDDSSFAQFVRTKLELKLRHRVASSGFEDVVFQFLEKLSSEELGKLLRKLVLHFHDRDPQRSQCESWLNLLPAGTGMAIGRKPNNLPYRSLGTLFKGREGFLEAMRSKLASGQTHALGVLAAQAIHGLGGVGKTRTAVEYAWRHQAEFSAILFVTADSPENLQRNLAGLIGPLVLDLPEAQHTTDQAAQVAGAVKWLQTHQNWFLILDNVDDEPTAKEVQRLVAQITQGQILITSRLSKWSKGVDTLALDVLAEQDACDFLLERTQGSDNLSRTTLNGVWPSPATWMDWLWRWNRRERTSRLSRSPSSSINSAGNRKDSRCWSGSIPR